MEKSFVRRAVLTPLLGINSTIHTVEFETIFDVFIHQRSDLLSLEVFQKFYSENRHLLVDTSVFIHVYSGVIDGDRLQINLPDCGRLVIVLDGFSSWKKLHLTIRGAKRVLLHQVKLLGGFVDAYTMGLEELILPICPQDCPFSNSYMYSGFNEDKIHILHKHAVDRYIHHHMTETSLVFSRWGEWPYFD